MLSWFPTAACKVKRLKEAGGGGGQGRRGLGQCKGLVKFNKVSGDSGPLNSPLHREFMDRHMKN